MPCPLVGRTKLSRRIQYFFIWSFVAAHVTCSNSEWGYRGFLWTNGTPKYISRNRAALVNISREQGNKPDFGGAESGNLENSPFSMHWPFAFVIVRQAITVFRCFIIIQKDADERKLTQAGRTNIGIYASNLRYDLCTQIPTILYAHGEWECLQSKFVNCCHIIMSWKGWFDQVGSLVLFNRACLKSTTGFSQAPLETAFSLHCGNTAWPPRLFQFPVIITSNFTCSKVILSGEFYHRNTVDPPARVKPPWDTKI